MLTPTVIQRKRRSRRGNERRRLRTGTLTVTISYVHTCHFLYYRYGLESKHCDETDFSTQTCCLGSYNVGPACIINLQTQPTLQTQPIRIPIYSSILILLSFKGILQEIYYTYLHSESHSNLLQSYVNPHSHLTPTLRESR